MRVDVFYRCVSSELTCLALKYFVLHCIAETRTQKQMKRPLIQGLTGHMFIIDVLSVRYALVVGFVDGVVASTSTELLYVAWFVV